MRGPQPAPPAADAGTFAMIGPRRDARADDGVQPRGSMMIAFLGGLRVKPARRPPGRPPSSGSHDGRANHLRALYRRRILGMSLRTVAFDMRISEATAKRWIAIARAYPEAESDESLGRFVAGLMAGY